MIMCCTFNNNSCKSDDVVQKDEHDSVLRTSVTPSAYQISTDKEVK